MNSLPNWETGPPWMRTIAGYFTPALKSGGFATKPCTSVPSLPRKEVSSTGAGRRDRGELVDGVGDQDLRPALQIRDLRAVGAPGRPALPLGMAVGDVVAGERPRRGARLRVDDVDVPVVVPVEILAALADEGD